MPMPRGVRWEVGDMTGADANRRLDQMSILNRFAVWELTGDRLADETVYRSACRQSED